MNLLCLFLFQLFNSSVQWDKAPKMIYLIMSSKPILKKKGAPCDLDVFLSSLVGINYVEPKSYCSFIITVDKRYEWNICDFKTYYLN